MDLYVIALRIIHIFSGVFWAGSAAMLVGFLEPTARATAPGSQQFMAHLMTRQRFATAITVTPILTVLAGALLYLRDSGGLQVAWILTGPGLGFTFGAIMGLSALVVGLFGIRPRTLRLVALGGAIQAGGKPPTPAQVSELTSVNAAVSKLTRVLFALVTLALLAMSTARYIRLG